MNHRQKPVTGTSDSHKRLSRLATLTLVLALVGTVLGSAVLLIGLQWRIDEFTTTAQPASSPADTSAQTTR
jgi:hypothetical protein